MKNIRIFYLKNFQFLMENFQAYFRNVLNGNMVEGIKAACRSKIAEIVSIRNQYWLPRLPS